MRSAIVLTALFLSMTAASIATPSADAVGICTIDDTYNNMGGPGSSCQGAACVGYSQGHWQTCVPRDVPVPPPTCTIVRC